MNDLNVRTVLNFTGAQTIKNVLLKNNSPCIFVGQMARYLHGLGDMPECVELVVLSSEAEEFDIPTFLCQVYSQEFRGLGDDGGVGFIYPVFPGRWCPFKITCVADTTVRYQSAWITTKQNLPTIGLLAVISDLAQSMVATYDHYTDTWAQPRGFSREEIHYLDDALQLSEHSLLESLDTDSNNEAKARLQRLSEILPPRKAATLEPIIRMIANPDNSPSRLRPRHLVEPKPSYGSIVPPQTQCLLNIAGEIVDILQENGVDCVLFGGLACTLYGSERVPNDVDLLTFPLPHLDAEDVKKLISEASPGRFHLKPSRNKKATWKILQCILTEQEKLVLSSLSNSCKIDILTPGTKDLPRIPSNRIMYLDTYPVMQFPALLLHKLQAWDDRRKQVGYARQYQKRLLDLEDLDRLFKLGEYVTRLRSSKLWQDRGLFSEQFEEASKIRALELCESYPEFAGRFRSVRLLT